jgi:hypothetical protein
MLSHLAFACSLSSDAENRLVVLALEVDLLGIVEEIMCAAFLLGAPHVAGDLLLLVLGALLFGWLGIACTQELMSRVQEQRLGKKGNPSPGLVRVCLPLDLDCWKSSLLAWVTVSPALLPSFSPNCTAVVASPIVCPDSTESRKGSCCASMVDADSASACSRD